MRGKSDRATLARVRQRTLGICPACGLAVLPSDDPVWTCPKDLRRTHPGFQDSPVTENQMVRDGDYSRCPSVHHLDAGFCELLMHLPLHGRCYELGNY